MSFEKAYHRYDPRLRNMVARTGDINLFPELRIPPSTARQWIKNGPIDFITIPEFSMDTEQLVLENQNLKQEFEKAKTEKELITKTIQVCGFQIQYRRLPSASTKNQIIESINTAANKIPLQTCLKIIGLSSQRFYAWMKRQVKCQLADRSSCPKISPTSLTSGEIKKIKEMVLDPELRHFSIAALSLYAKKVGKVFASYSVWSRIIKDHKLIRPGKRTYPPKPRIGIRASKPCQIWHLDQSIIRLADGTRCFIQAVIDNFSRYVLAFKVTKDYGGTRTKFLLKTAILKAEKLGFTSIPEVYCDSGSENDNEEVSSLIRSKHITLTFAQLDVIFSNSMIEALFHRLKNRYLYFQQLTSFEAVVKHVEKYITDANELIPHLGIGGATPLELITGKWPEILNQIKSGAAEARAARYEFNRSSECTTCPG